MDKLWKTPFFSVDKQLKNLWITCEKKTFLSYPQNRSQVIHGLIHKDIHRKKTIFPFYTKGSDVFRGKKKGFPYYLLFIINNIIPFNKK